MSFRSAVLSFLRVAPKEQPRQSFAIPLGVSRVYTNGEPTEFEWKFGPPEPVETDGHRRAQIGDYIRITDAAWDYYYGQILKEIPSDSWLAGQLRYLKDRDLEVAKLFEGRQAPLVRVPQDGWHVVEHAWYEVVE